MKQKQHIRSHRASPAVINCHERASCVWFEVYDVCQQTARPLYGGRASFCFSRISQVTFLHTMIFENKTNSIMTYSCQSRFVSFFSFYNDELWWVLDSIIIFVWVPESRTKQTNKMKTFVEMHDGRWILIILNKYPFAASSDPSGPAIAIYLSI